MQNFVPFEMCARGSLQEGVTLRRTLNKYVGMPNPYSNVAALGT